MYRFGKCRLFLKLSAILSTLRTISLHFLTFKTNLAVKSNKLVLKKPYATITSQSIYIQNFIGFKPTDQ